MYVCVDKFERYITISGIINKTRNQYNKKGKELNKHYIMAFLTDDLKDACGDFSLDLRNAMWYAPELTPDIWELSKSSYGLIKEPILNPNYINAFNQILYSSEPQLLDCYVTGHYIDTNLNHE